MDDRRVCEDRESFCRQVSIMVAWSRSMFAANPVTVGLLLYVAFFQMVIYRSQGDSGSVLHNSRLAATSLEPPFAIIGRETMMITAPTVLQQQQRRGGVGVFPRHPVLPPQNPVPWKRYSAQPIQVPYPVLVTSLPKSGTTSMFKYMKCGGQLSSHNWITKKGARKATLAGKCIQKNIREGKPPFANCGANDVFSDTGYLNYDHDPGLECYFPSVDGLNAIYDSYPNATFVNVVRDTEAWYTSLRNWSHSSLFVRFRLCNATGFPNGQSTKSDFMRFYEAHNEMIRQFVRDRPSLTYIEVQLESPDTGRILEEATGITADCWKKCKPEERLCEGEVVAEEEER